MFKLLQQPEYVHVLINHLPLTGLFVALLCLIGALVTRNRAAIYLGMALVSVFALSAWPVSEYGEDGYDRVYSMADDAGGTYLKQHKELAERWTWVFYVTAAAGVAGMVAGWKWPKCLGATACAVALLTAGSLCAGAVIADYGGKVRHPEFRRRGELQSAQPSGQPVGVPIRVPLSIITVATGATVSDAVFNRRALLLQRGEELGDLAHTLA